MRTISTLCILFFFSVSGIAQEAARNIQFVSETDVPYEVIESQRVLFPNALVSEWQVQKKDRSSNALNMRYISKMEKDGNSNLTVSYLPDGLWLYTTEFIPKENIYEGIHLDIKKKYPQYKIQEVNLIHFATPQKELYLLKLLDNSRMQYVFYDSSGKEIKPKDLPMEMMMLVK